MTNVVLVCVAGVSGTFLARRMRALAPDLNPVVTTVSALEQTLPGAHVVLIAPQLAGDADLIARRAGAVPTVILPAAAYGPTGAESAVRAVRDAVPTASGAYGDRTSTLIKE